MKQKNFSENFNKSIPQVLGVPRWETVQITEFFNKGATEILHQYLESVLTIKILFSEHSDIY